MTSPPLTAASLEATNPALVRYDAPGVLLPVFLVAVAAVACALFWLVQAQADRAAHEAATIAFYGGLSVMFAYIPYITGYAAFRIAALSSSSHAVLCVAGAGIVGSGAAALLFAAAGDASGALMLVLVFGIPSSAGVVACAAQIFAETRLRSSSPRMR